MDYKIGDIIKHIQNNIMTFGKIEKIEDNKLWCHWSDRVEKEPKTPTEFNAIRKRSNLQYIYTYSKYLQGVITLDINKRIS